MPFRIRNKKHGAPAPDQIAEGRLQVFVGHSINAALWSPFGTGLLAYIQGPVAGWGRALAWFCLINIVQLLIIGVARRYRQARAGGGNGLIEARSLVGATLLAGMAWGSSVYFFWLPGENVFYLTNLIFLVGVTGVCIVIMSPVRLALALFAAGTLLPPVLQLYFLDGYTWKAQTAAGLIAMLLFSLKYGRISENQLTTSLTEVLRNELLAAQLVQQTQAIEIAKAELSEAFAVAHIGSWVYQFNIDSLRQSPQACQIYDVPEGTEGSRQLLLDLTMAADRAGLQAAWADALLSGRFDHEHRINAGATICWVRQKGKIEFDAAGTPVRAVGITQDITARKRADDEIKSLAFYDPLTLLPNRRLMLDRLRAATLGSAGQQRAGALLLIDLDEFKRLNDTLGHDVGDRFLVEVGQRIQACVRVDDTVARLGGDEFVVILEGLHSGQDATEQARAIARKINLAIGAPFLLQLTVEDIHDVHSYLCTSSIGIALFHGQDLSTDEVMKRADTAMYHAKQDGRSTFRFFDATMQRDVEQRARLSVELHEALRLAQFVLHYQPQVDRHGRVTGVEALVRWCHPTLGLVEPARFIGEAEANGLIMPIGRWVLEAACAQLALWHEDAATAHLTLAVNVSARQFRQPEFVAQTRAVLARSGIDPGRLKLELTESLMLDNVEESITKMAALQQTGVSFSLDDFGTGYSSLSCLKRLPLAQLKIDRAFVRDILDDPDDAAITAAIITLGGALGLTVIAEGVETAAQHDFLISQGCDVFQGFLFSAPLPLAAFERYVRATNLAAVA